MQSHFILGLSIFLVTLIRAALRVFTDPPTIKLKVGAWPGNYEEIELFAKVSAVKPEPPEIITILSQLTHTALYLMMLGLPIVGWLMLTTKGYSASLLGLELPSIATISLDNSKKLIEVHALVGKMGYFIIAIHTAVALIHHYVLKNNALKRMML